MHSHALSSYQFMKSTSMLFVSIPKDDEKKNCVTQNYLYFSFSGSQSYFYITHEITYFDKVEEKNSQRTVLLYKLIGNSIFFFLHVRKKEAERMRLLAENDGETKIYCKDHFSLQFACQIPLFPHHIGCCCHFSCFSIA